MNNSTQVPGAWSGYTIEFQINGVNHVVTTIEGVRGQNIPVTVHVLPNGTIEKVTKTARQGEYEIAVRYT